MDMVPLRRGEPCPKSCRQDVGHGLETVFAVSNRVQKSLDKVHFVLMPCPRFADTADGARSTLSASAIRRSFSFQIQVRVVGRLCRGQVELRLELPARVLVRSEIDGTQQRPRANARQRLSLSARRRHRRFRPGVRVWRTLACKSYSRQTAPVPASGNIAPSWSALPSRTPSSAIPRQGPHPFFLLSVACSYGARSLRGARGVQDRISPLRKNGDSSRCSETLQPAKLKSGLMMTRSNGCSVCSRWSRARKVPPVTSFHRTMRNRSFKAPLAPWSRRTR